MFRLTSGFSRELCSNKRDPGPLVHIVRLGEIICSPGGPDDPCAQQGSSQNLDKASPKPELGGERKPRQF